MCKQSWGPRELHWAAYVIVKKGFVQLYIFEKNMDESSASLNRFEDTKDVIRNRKLMFVFVFFVCLFDGI